MKFNFEKPNTNKSESQNENNQEKKKFREKIKQALKPMLYYGMYGLAIFSTLDDTKNEQNPPTTKEKDDLEIVKPSKNEINDVKTFVIPEVIHGPLTHKTEHGGFSSEQVRAVYEKYETEEGFPDFDNSKEDIEIFSQNILNNKKLLDEITKGAALSISEQKDLISKKYSKIAHNINETRGYYNYYDKSKMQDFDDFQEIIENDKTFERNITTQGELNEREIERIKEYQHNPSKTASTRKWFHDQIEKGYKIEMWEHHLKRLKIFEEENFNIEKIQERFKEISSQEKFLSIQKNINEIEIQRKDLLEKMKSDAYLKKLTIELEGDEESARKLQQERINHVENRSFYLSNFSNGTKEHARGHMEYKNGGYVALPNENAGYTSTHEFSHLADHGGENIPEQTKKKLSEHYSFKEKQKEHEKEHDVMYLKKYNQEYYSDPSEILARKAVFDNELEKLNIKKYEEEFTKDHYKKIKRLQESGKLDKNSDQFFRMYERDALIMIMNTVAESNSIERENMKNNPDMIIDNYMNNFDDNLEGTA